MPLRKRCSIFLLIVLFTAAISAQIPKEPVIDPADQRLPNGKSQKEEILKADHEKSLDDAVNLMDLTDELKIELVKHDRHVLSVSTLKQLEDIEKLTNRIRSRLRRY